MSKIIEFPVKYEHVKDGKNYLSILGLQLKLNLDCDSKNEFLIETENLKKQLMFVKELIKSKNPDVIIFPEMSYQTEMQDYFTELSTNKLIVGGSIYNDGINETIVFQDGNSYKVRKYNASGAEPMIRVTDKCTPEYFMRYYLDEHTFVIGGKKMVVLNCMEYYQNAYYIARNIPDLFGIICICSNNNPKVFLDETKAIHNHVEGIYTFMVNCVSKYKGEEYAKGESYVYGPIQGHEKEWLIKEGIKMDEHLASILRLGSEEEYFYGKFRNDFSRFGRSDEYINNPKNIEVGNIRKKVLK